MEELIRQREERTESDEREGRGRQVDKVYARLRSKSPYSPLPTLSTFRQLGVISVVLNNRKKTAAAAKEEMASPVFQSLLEDNLSMWRENQQRVLLKLIGSPNYRHVSKTKPHPLDLYSARFNCTKCKDQAAKQFKPISLSFADVCKHECVGSKHKSKNSSGAWSISQFVLDEKAVNATKQFFGMVNLKEDNADVGDLFARLKVLCQSCDGKVVIKGLDGLHAHCQRHDNMKFLVFTGDTTPCLQWGLRDELLSRNWSAAKKRKSKSFGCRHCPPARANSNSSHGKRRVDAFGRTRTEQKHYRLLDFDGIRSHLKSRHGVENIADEDFFRILDDEVEV